MAITVVKAPGNITSVGSITTAKLTLFFDEVFFVPTAKSWTFTTGKSITPIVVNPPVFNPTGYTDVDYVYSILLPQFTAALGTWYTITVDVVNPTYCYMVFLAKGSGPSYNMECTAFPTGLESLENNTEFAAVGVFSNDVVNVNYLGVEVLDPVEYVLQTNNLITTAGVREKIEIQFTAFVLTGTTLIFNVFGKTLTFTFKEFGPFGDYDIRTLITGITMQQWAADYVLPVLLRNYVLSTNFNITCTDDYIVLEAVEVGTKYNLVVTPGHANLVVTSLANGVDVVKRSNFELLLDIYTENEYLSDNYSLAYSGTATPNSALQCRFDIAKQLQALIKPSLAFPPFSTLMDSPVFTATTVKRYFLKYAELYGDPQAAQAYNFFASKSIITALFGGHKVLNFAQEGFVNTYFDSDVVKFLTDMPQGIEVTTEQHQYLSFYLNKSNGSAFSMKLRVKLYYDDGTSSANIDSTTFSKSANGIYTVPVGYNTIGVDALKAAGKTVVKYDVWVANTANEAITTTQTFSVSTDYHRNNRYFVFLNSLGVIETIWFTGSKKVGYQHSSQLVERVHYRDNHEATGIYSGDLVEQNHTAEHDFELSTGFKNKAFVEYAQGFLFSVLRYEIMADKLAQVVIDKSKVDLYDDYDTDFGFKFSYSYAWKEGGIA